MIAHRRGRVIEIAEESRRLIRLVPRPKRAAPIAPPARAVEVEPF